MRKYLRLVLIKDTPWWLLSEEVSVAKKSHTLHSCWGWESGLCLRGAAGLLRKLVAALQKGTEIGSSWSRRFSLLWTLSLSSLSTASLCIRSLSISHTASYTASDSAQAPGLSLLTVAPQPQGLFLYCTHAVLNVGFFLCLLSSPLAKYWPLQHPDRASTKRRARSPTCCETELGGGSKKGLAEPWEFNRTCRVSPPPAGRDSFCSCRHIAGSQCSYSDGKLNLTLALTRESILSTHGQIKPFSLGKPLVTTDISRYRHCNGTQHQDKVLACQGEKRNLFDRHHTRL